MKAADIIVGGYYTDGKGGLREVIAEGDAITSYPGAHDGDCVRYISHLSSRPSDDGLCSNMTRRALASWSKKQLTIREVQTLMQVVAAERILKRLTQPQKTFLATFDSDVEEGTRVECHRSEFSIARNCSTKGIFTLISSPLSGGAHHFDVEVTLIGASVIRHLATSSET
jgi:hypothetical protein